MSELKTSCANEADVKPPMSVSYVEVDYELHNNTAFIQVEKSLQYKDVEETEGLSQIRPSAGNNKASKMLTLHIHEILSATDLT